MEIKSPWQPYHNRDDCIHFFAFQIFSFFLSSYVTLELQAELEPVFTQCLFSGTVKHWDDTCMRV